MHQQSDHTYIHTYTLACNTTTPLYNHWQSIFQWCWPPTKKTVHHNKVPHFFGRPKKQEEGLERESESEHAATCTIMRTITRIQTRTHINYVHAESQPFARMWRANTGRREDQWRGGHAWKNSRVLEDEQLRVSSHRRSVVQGHWLQPKWRAITSRTMLPNGNDSRSVPPPPFLASREATLSRGR